MPELIDLSHLLNDKISVYPGTNKPLITKLSSVSENGYVESGLNLLSHHGTHIDAPAHLIEDGKYLDQYKVLFHKKRILRTDCQNFSNYVIDIENLKFFEKDIQDVDFVLLHTGWSKKWGTEAYLINYPVLSPGACEWLCSYKIKGIGLDTISLDTIGSQSLQNHHILLSKGKIIIENLTNLEKLGYRVFNLSCFPLKFIDSDGSPVRAVAFL